jgi:tRNA(Ile)-lysidine synthase
MHQFRSDATTVSDNLLMIEIVKIQESPAPALILWELVKAVGFNFDQCRKIIQTHQAGKVFHTDTHQLIVDRQFYMVAKKADANFKSISIQPGERMVGDLGYKLSITEKLKREFNLTRDPALAQLDADLLEFPIIWRAWQAGDYFMPLGMQQEKKLSDFLIDLKIPFHRKADVTVLESGGRIAWVVGLRISEHYKITPDTKRVLVIEQQTFKPEKKIS